MATIKDVAKEAGVAICTVSYAINGTAPVAEETKRRIFAAIKKLDYHPNRVAQGLVKKKTDTIGLVLPRSASETFGHQLVFLETLRGVTEAASNSGYYTLLLYDQEPGEKEKRQCGTPLACYQSKSVDGLLFVSPRKCQRTMVPLAEGGFPVVMAGGLSEQFPFPVVDIDNIEGARLATQYLLELGHEAVGYLSPDSLSYIYCSERQEGYRRALSEAGISPRDSWEAVADYTSEGCAAAARLLLEQPQRPTALFLGSDWMYPYVLEAARELGISVPKDLSIVGFDDSLTARVVFPRLTSVRCLSYDIGHKATRMLINMIESSAEPDPKACILDTELVVRESTCRRD